MRAIINGILYDTAISSVLYSNGSQCLFKTYDGLYFKTSELGLNPLSIDETKEYLGINDVDVYIKEFGSISGNTIEKTKEYQKVVVNYQCQNVINNGIDIETTQGIEHFSLTEKDQINIKSLYDEIKNNTSCASAPYHADGKICRLFTMDEMTSLFNAMKEFVIYNITKCNHLHILIDSLETVNEILAISFESNLPDSLQSNMIQILGLE